MKFTPAQYVSTVEFMAAAEAVCIHSHAMQKMHARTHGFYKSKQWTWHTLVLTH